MPDREIRPRLEVTGFSDLFSKFPNHLVAFQITQEGENANFSRGIVISVGRKIEEDRVIQDLVQFRQANPGAKVGLLFTGVQGVSLRSNLDYIRRRNSFLLAV